MALTKSQIDEQTSSYFGIQSRQYGQDSSVSDAARALGMTTTPKGMTTDMKTTTVNPSNGAKIAWNAPPKLSWWDQHIVGGYNDLRKFMAPTKDELLTKMQYAPVDGKPETLDQSLANIGEARKQLNVGNNDLAASSLISGATFGLVRPHNLSEVPLNDAEQGTQMIGQTLGSSVFSAAGPAASAAEAVAPSLVSKIPVIGKPIESALAPGSNALVNWAKSGLPSAVSNVAAGQTSIAMDSATGSERAKRALQDAGFSYALHLLHLPTDKQEAAAFKDAPTLEFQHPAELDAATQHLVESGNVPVAQKDLGHGELGITTEDAAGNTKLYKVAPAPSEGNNVIQLNEKGLSHRYTVSPEDYQASIKAQDAYDKAVSDLADRKSGKLKDGTVQSYKDAVAEAKDTLTKTMKQATGHYTQAEVDALVAHEQGNYEGKQVTYTAKSGGTKAATVAAVPSDSSKVSLTFADGSTHTVEANRVSDPRSQDQIMQEITRGTTPLDAQAAPAAPQAPVADQTVNTPTAPTNVAPAAPQEAAPAPVAASASQEPVPAPQSTAAVVNPGGTGEMRQSRLAARQGLDVKYERSNQDAVINSRIQFIKDNPEEAWRIYTGEVQPPEGMSQQELAAAYNKMATNPETARAIVNGSGSVSLESTKKGQDIAILAKVDQSDPVSVMKELRRAKTEAIGGEQGLADRSTKEAAKLTTTIKEAPVTQDEAASFLAAIKDAPSNSKLLKALQSGEVSLDDLKNAANSEERNAILAKYVGADRAQKINATFEKTTLLKNQKNAMIRWAQESAGIKPPVRKDLIASINRLGEVLNPQTEAAFKADLVAQRLGSQVTAEEARVIFKNANTIKENPVGPAYAKARLENEKIIADAKAGKKMNLGFISAITKSVGASFDNSYQFRQNLGVWTSHPIMASKNLVKSFQILADQLGSNEDALAKVRLGIYSRENMAAYDRMGIKLSGFEEQNPVDLSKVPVLGRIWKASEAAFTGTADLTRADLADNFIRLADKAGTVRDPQWDKSMGRLVNTWTGAGDAHLPGFVNNVIWSPKTVVANFDKLTFDLRHWSSNSPMVRREAALATSKFIGVIAATMAVSNAISPGSADPDSRGSDFGKIKIGDTRFDITGGAGSLVVLASRLLPTYQAGGGGNVFGVKDLGFYSKSTKTGEVNTLNSDKYGSQTPIDVLTGFAENKTAPLASLVIDLWKQQDFGGKPLTVQGELAKLLPLGVSNYQELINDPNSANLMLAMIADGLGLVTNTYDQGQSQGGDKGVKAQLIMALVNNDTATARQVLTTNFPVDKQNEVFASAAQSAGAYVNRQQNKTVDFYQVYSPVSKERDKVSTQVTDLVRQGKTQQATRVANDFNQQLPSHFSAFYQKHGGEKDPYVDDRVQSLAISVTPAAFASRKQKQ